MGSAGRVLSAESDMGGSDFGNCDSHLRLGGGVQEECAGKRRARRDCRVEGEERGIAEKKAHHSRGGQLEIKET